MTKINLLPEEQAPKPQVNVKRVIFVVILEVAIVSATAFYAYRHYSIAGMKRELEQLERQLASMQQDLDALGQVEKRTREVQALVDETLKIQAEHLEPGRVLREVRGIMPQDVWLTGLNLAEAGTVAVDGASFSVESATRLALALEDSPVFGDVKVGSIRLASAGKQRVYQFSMQCALETGR